MRLQSRRGVELVQRIQAAQEPDKQESDSKKHTVSSIAFPYTDLEDAEAVVQALYANSGFAACERGPLSAWLKHESASSGTFRVRLAAARLFGLIETTQDSVKLTQLGYEILQNSQQRAARVQAFLHVPLYHQLYERYKTRTLPSDIGIEQEMVELGVAPKQKAKARQAFQRSARQAGFFAQNPSRLVPPTGLSLSNEDMSHAKITTQLNPQQAPDRPLQQQNDHTGSNGGGGNDGGSGTQQFPQQFLQFLNNTLVRALIEDLARNDIPWTQAQREEWIELAKLVLKRVHPVNQQGADQRPSSEEGKMSQ